MAKWLVWLRGFAVANLICPCCLHVTAVLTLRDRRAVISVGMGGTQQQRGTRSWYYLNGLSGAMEDILGICTRSLIWDRSSIKCSPVCIGLGRTQRHDFSTAVRCYIACKAKGNIFVNLMEYLCVSVIWLRQWAWGK